MRLIREILRALILLLGEGSQLGEEGQLEALLVIGPVNLWRIGRIRQVFQKLGFWWLRIGFGRKELGGKKLLTFNLKGLKRIGFPGFFLFRKLGKRELLKFIYFIPGYFQLD